MPDAARPRPVDEVLHEMEGYNGRLDAIQAGFLRVKLRSPGEVDRAAAGARLGYDQLSATRRER